MQSRKGRKWDMVMPLGPHLNDAIGHVGPCFLNHWATRPGLPIRIVLNSQMIITYTREIALRVLRYG